MNEALTLTFALAVPFLCLGLVLWLARLEDTLTDGLESPAAVPVAAPAGAPLPAAAGVPAPTPADSPKPTEPAPAAA
jgi:hypothetical protein